MAYCFVMASAEKVTLVLFDFTLRGIDGVQRRPQLSWACCIAGCLIVATWALLGEFVGRFRIGKVTAGYRRPAKQMLGDSAGITLRRVGPFLLDDGGDDALSAAGVPD
jgi:hypothetical protein